MKIINESGWLDSLDSIEFTNVINANHATLKQQQQWKMNIITQTEEKQESLFEEDITKSNSSTTTLQI